ncbi:myrosinase 1-like [Wyeomyia smithii]|uniref:myrosinase 1-like n=1 Tax=Wyeomyia smithii TaxID=174621 RepID=UPI002467D418|nr:myrosinase 1-like [Wyeomyia smithii]XP_055550382.1 myrosinase 1-like [Wyeomyia smithii]
MKLTIIGYWLLVGIFLPSYVVQGTHNTPRLVAVPAAPIGDGVDVRKFPSYFAFGAATAAYQIEGGWNEDGKGASVWDTLTHQHPELVVDRANGDVAADSYHRFREDIAALEEVGFSFYRFSISWSRILPEGDLSSLRLAGIQYYNNLINSLLEANITPVVTMLHYDVPQYVQNLGGLASPLFVQYFKIYADTLFRYFGDRVKVWITHNEPWDFCVTGYGSGTEGPLVHAPGVGEYLCAHHVLLSHATVFHLYDEKYRKEQAGSVGITLSGRFFYPANSKTGPDVVDRALQYQLGWFAHPLFSGAGGYPPLMVQEIADHSLRENRTMSRLPEMSDEIKQFIRGSADFLGYNYYSSRLVELDKRDYNESSPPSVEKDTGVLYSVDRSWKRAKSSWLYVVPKGLRGVLNWFKKEYNNPPVLITENGYSDDGQLEDHERIDFYRSHLTQLLDAILIDKCNVFGFTTWSIVDNFEWLRGYSEKFGLYHVNFSSSNRERVPKLSSKFFKTVIQSGTIPT